LLDFAIETAREAGRVLAERFGRASLEVSHKGDIDLVTESDLAAERVIVERIRSYYPRHAILAEESGASEHEGAAASGYKWIVDPLDGTTNYAHGYPCYCVSIALERDGELVIGVIHDPTRDETFAAERGAGATLNGRRIHVSEASDLNEALLSTGYPYDVRGRDNFVRNFKNFILHAQGVRRDGSAALDLAYVACGRFEGFWEEGLRAWDVAAGVLLIEEAGGRVSRYDGSPFDIYSPPIMASNGLVHEAMMRVLALRD
jgi:myo-inositol-1(or 4)-monophosphatase